MSKRIPLIVQARVQSTRYPGKVLQPFAEGLNLLEFQLRRLKETFPDAPIVVATAEGAADDPIEGIARRMEVSFFRGDEQDVLKRFVDCCRYFGFTGKVMRICGDNPFMQVEFLQRLMAEATESTMASYDYIGFSIDNIPAIRTHFGFFSEVVAVKALLYVLEHVKDPHFHEHVTSYIYESTGKFNIRLLEITTLRPYLGCLRLTVDNREDLENAVFIYQQLRPTAGPSGPSWKEIVSFVENQPAIKRRMIEQIRSNTK